MKTTRLNSHRLAALGFGAALTLSTFSCLNAQNSPVTDPGSTAVDNAPREKTRPYSAKGTAGEVTRGDRKFILDAGKLGEGEVAIARLAVQKTADTRLRDFSQQMIADHEAVNAELRQLASRKGVDLLSESTESKALKRLSEKSGGEFDENYAEQLVADHKDAVDLFEKASRKADDAEVAAFASKHLPALREHLQHAQALRKVVNH